MRRVSTPTFDIWALYQRFECGADCVTMVVLSEGDDVAVRAMQCFVRVLRVKRRLLMGILRPHLSVFVNAA